GGHFLREIFQQRTVVRLGIERFPLDDLSAGVEDQRKNKARCHYSFFFAQLQIDEQLIEQFGKPSQTRDVGLRVFHVIDLVNVNQESRHLGMDATHLTDRINVEAILKF